MTWQFTDQVQTYARRTWPLLAAAPARNTIALTVIENVLAGRRWSSEAMTFGWFTAGELAVGAICMTPPYELLLAEVPASAIEPLVDALLARGTAVPGVNGEAADAKAFAAAWTARRPARAVARRQERLYQLGTLLPARPAAGRPRPGHTADLPTAVGWFTRFQVEAGVHLVDVEPAGFVLGRTFGPLDALGAVWQVSTNRRRRRPTCQDAVVARTALVTGVG